MNTTHIGDGNMPQIPNIVKIVTNLPESIPKIDTTPTQTGASRKSKPIPRGSQRYARDADYRQARILRERERYANDTDYRQATLQRLKERWANDPDYRKAKARSRRERYASDPEVRKVESKRSSERYANNPEYREATKQRARERYWRMKFGLPSAQQEPQNKSDSQDSSKKSDAAP